MIQRRRAAALAALATATIACRQDATTCDATTLEWAIIELSETEVYERPAVAAQGLIDACGAEIPDVHRARILAVANVGDRVDEPGTHPPSVDDLEQAEALLRSACPSSMFLEMATMEPSELERRRQRFRRCGFDALGLMDEAEFVRHDHIAAFSMFGWLRDQGVDEEVARVLVREAMVRGHRQPPTLPAEATTLPRSSSSSAVQAGPRVFLSATSMDFAGLELAAIMDGDLDSLGEERALAGLIVGLEELRLGDAGAHDSRLPRMVLVPDQGVTTGALFAVMEAAASVGYAEYQIVGVQPEVSFPELGMNGVDIEIALDTKAAAAAPDSDLEMVCRPPYTVARGTIVYAPDGSEVGVATREERFAGDPTLVNGLTCFRRVGRWLCFAELPPSLG